MRFLRSKLINFNHHLKFCFMNSILPWWPIKGHFVVISNMSNISLIHCLNPRTIITFAKHKPLKSALHYFTILSTCMLCQLFSFYPLWTSMHLLPYVSAIFKISIWIGQLYIAFCLPINCSWVSLDLMIMYSYFIMTFLLSCIIKVWMEKK